MTTEKTPEIKRILFYKAKESLNILKNGELLEPAAWDNLRSLLEKILVSRKNLMLFLGAGTSMTIKDVKVDPGERAYRPLSWMALLEGLFNKLDESEQIEFLKDQTLDNEGKVSKEERSNKKKWFEKVATFKDKPTLAWHLRLYFKHDESINERNQKLYELVSKPLKRSEYTSELLEQIVKLPFKDIITTNFDDAIEKFLRDENNFRKQNKHIIKEKRGYNVDELKYFPIFDLETFLESIQDEAQHRLFYIHGKADKYGKNFLVFDKFDFAKLIAENDSILEYLIWRTARSTIIYFGFGLDDQTFNYIQERLRKIFNNNTRFFPFSYVFSTQKSKTEIKAFKDMHIRVISYSKHEDLPKILEHVNTILEYFRQFPENEFPLDEIPCEEEISIPYRKAGREAYLSENHEESLKNYRLAFATLLFAKDIEPHNVKGQWERNKIFIEIRRQLVLSLSKLRWQDSSYFDEQTDLLKGTITRAEKLIEESKINLKNNHLINGDLAIKAQEASINVLNARILAHEGLMKDSFDEFDKFDRTFRNKSENKELLRSYVSMLNDLQHKSYDTFFSEKEKIFKEDLKKTDDTSKQNKLKEDIYKYKVNEDTLLLGYSYIFAREQRKRHHVFLGDRNITKAYIRKELKYCKGYQTLITEFTKKDNSKYFRNDLSISLHTLGSVLIIGLWEIGSRFIRFSSEDLLPKNIPDFDKYIEKAIELFNYDEEYFNQEDNCIPIDKEKRMNILPSIRWQTKMYRHKCRAYMLKWVKNEQDEFGSGNKDDLHLAFTSFKKALDLSIGANLKPEILKNCLESVKMNTLVMIYTPENHPSYALSESACYYYLNQAVEIIHELLGEKDANLSLKDLLKPNKQYRQIRWLTIFVLKIASYFKIAVNDRVIALSNPTILSKNALKEFLNKDIDDVKEFVIKAHQNYNNKNLAKVICRYKVDFDKTKKIVKDNAKRKNL